MRALVFGVFTIWALGLSATTLHVGPGRTYANATQAAADARPGDTVLIHPGVYDRTAFIEELHGRVDAPIVFRGTGTHATVMGGGTESLHFINVSYIVIENLVFERNTGNGVNIDDGGDYSTPSHHVTIRDCIFRDMGATGNNDFLKLSGLDSFHVKNCLFENGAAGGSGIDMVGCHWGLIEGNRFFRLGSNSIQAKGGTRYIRIAANYFEDGGMRTMNLGGSTGAAFFRPFGVNYEARDLEVVSNVVVGSDAPVAYVSSQNVRVWNNTFYKPTRWVLRILQESGDTSFYRPVSHGAFVNNIIIVDDALRTTVNIGPLTRPETFRFSHNLWWNTDDPSWTPDLPTPDNAQLTGQDPLLTDPANGDWTPLAGSPAIGSGATLFDAFDDYTGLPFAAPPSRGAVEGNRVTNVPGQKEEDLIIIAYPNPVSDQLSWSPDAEGAEVKLTHLSGRVALTGIITSEGVDVSDLSAGLYHWQVTRDDKSYSGKVVIVH
jgi:hypothetical protein